MGRKQADRLVANIDKYGATLWLLQMVQRREKIENGGQSFKQRERAEAEAPALCD